MVIYIPNHLKESIPLLKDMTKMIEKYNKDYRTKSVGSFDLYYNHQNLSSIRKFIEICLNNSDVKFPEGIDQENIINYLSALFYNVKGTRRVFDYMRDYLGISIKKEEITYTVSSLVLNIDEISTTNIFTYVESLKDFLSSLLYYGDLVSEIKKISLKVNDSIKVSISSVIQKYKEVNLEDVFDPDKGSY